MDEVRRFSSEIERKRALGVIAPHAGYMYSGAVAGAVYSRVLLPHRIIILCPNHTGMGAPISVMTHGAWCTPLGDVPVDAEIAEALLAENSGLEEDVEAHRFEHAIEVQLPFLQHHVGASLTITPITVGEIGRAHV